MLADPLSYQVSHASTQNARICDIAWTSALDGILRAEQSGSVRMWRSNCATVARDAGGACVSRNMDVAWTAGCAEQQDVLAAGADINAPCASASRAGEKGVHVFWPEQQHDAGAGRAQADKNKSGGKGAKVCSDKLRHLCHVTGLQWHGAASRTGGPAGDAGQRRRGGTHPALFTVGSDGVVRVWVEVMVMRYATDGEGAVCCC